MKATSFFGHISFFVYSSQVSTGFIILYLKQNWKEKNQKLEIYY